MSANIQSSPEIGNISGEQHLNFWPFELSMPYSFKSMT